MNLSNYNHTEDQTSISSYSQQRSVNSKAQRKQKALFTLAGAIFIAMIFSFGLLSNTNLSSAANDLSKNEISNATEVATGADKDHNQQANGTAVSSTNTDPAAVKNCTPVKSYLKPNRPVANSYSNSVISNPTTASTYRVYGNSADQINNQIFSCTPVLTGGKRFAASTDYAISWSVSYSRQSNGICTVASAGVALNQSMVFPEWKADKNSSAQTKADWQHFITHLREHEEEHAEINRKYANRILSELKSLPAGGCATINNRAKSKANSLVSSLNNANQKLDSHTNHGQTTGAHL